MDQRTQYSGIIRYGCTSPQVYASPQAFVSPQAYSSSEAIPSTPNVASYPPEETVGYGSALNGQRHHSASFSTASGSSVPYPPIYQRSYSDPDWTRTYRSAPQSTIVYQNGPYTSPNATYQTDTYYTQSGMNETYYPAPATTYPASTYTTASSLVSIHTNSLPDQNRSFLSPQSATSPTTATYNYPRDPDPSVSPSSEDVPPEYLSKRNRQHHCGRCEKAFKRKADLQRHATCVHCKETAEKYFCDAKVCDRNEHGIHGGFTRKDHLVEHLRNFHHRDIPKKLRHRGFESEQPMASQPNGAMGLTNSLQANNATVYPYGNYESPESDGYPITEAETSGYHQETYAEDES